jgi:hypothetical protein
MLSLLLSAELTGVTDLRPKDTEQDPYFYTFKVQCTSCREVHPNWVSFNRFEQHEIPGSRGEANFVWKCKLCQKTHSASIVNGPHAYAGDEKRKGTKVIEIDCRGLEFTEFKPDVSVSSILSQARFLTMMRRENGKQRGLNPPRLSLV